MEQGARCGTRSRAPGIMTWAEGRCLTDWATQAPLWDTIWIKWSALTPPIIRHLTSGATDMMLWEGYNNLEVILLPPNMLNLNLRKRKQPYKSKFRDFLQNHWPKLFKISMSRNIFKRLWDSYKRRIKRSDNSIECTELMTYGIKIKKKQ